MVPVEVTAGSTTFNFNMATLGATREIEYLNGVVEGRIGTGTLNSPANPAPAAEYSFFLWTGAMDPTNSSIEELARAGVFSQGWNLPVGGGSGPVNNPPNAVLTTPDPTGPDPGPLTVNFTMSGSTDSDGTIQNYQFDDGLAAGWEYEGATPDDTQSATYTADGVYTARLTVTDDDGDPDTATITIIIGSPPVFWDLDIVALMLLADWPSAFDPKTTGPWQDGANFLTVEVRQIGRGGDVCECGSSNGRDGGKQFHEVPPGLCLAGEFRGSAGGGASARFAIKHPQAPDWCPKCATRFP